MTVTSLLNRKDYTGDAATVAFAFTFSYFATSDIAVYLDSVLQTEVTHYTVAPASGTSGTVTMVTAPGSGVLVTIIRELPLTQGIDLPTAGKFPANTVEEGLDRAMAAVRDVQERIDRSVVQAVSSTLTGITLPAPVAFEGFRWNADADNLESVIFSALGVYADPITVRGDILRGSAAGAAESLALGVTKKYVKSNGTDVVWDYVKSIYETGDPQVLDIASIPEGRPLKRSGTDVVGGPTAVTGFNGLRLMTHPDRTSMFSKVMLVQADEIVMDTGLRVTGWDKDIADITVEGAVGGLDAGSEAASAWYAVYAIAQNDGTKGLLLHRTKNFLNDESQLLNDGRAELRWAAADTFVAQGFKTTNSSEVDFVDVLLYRIGAPSGNVWWEIWGDTGGDPNPADVKATSDKIPADKMTGASAWVRVPFRTPFSTTAATQYHLVMQGDYALSAANYVQWRGKLADVYAGGVAQVSEDGITWAPTGTAAFFAPASNDNDFAFKIYTRENDTSVTMPSGYTGKCLIGYVYNDSGSDFRLFQAQNKLVRYAADEDDTFVASAAAQFPVLLDISGFVPPVPVAVGFGVAGNIANMTLGAAGVPHGYAGSVVAGTIPRGSELVQIDTLSTTAPFAALTPIPTEYQGSYHSETAAGTTWMWVQQFIW